jgi:hypothetical protein
MLKVNHQSDANIMQIHKACGAPAQHPQCGRQQEDSGRGVHQKAHTLPKLASRPRLRSVES